MFSFLREWYFINALRNIFLNITMNVCWSPQQPWIYDAFNKISRNIFIFTYISLKDKIQNKTRVIDGK
jgi:hypothetical protein